MALPLQSANIPSPAEIAEVYAALRNEALPDDGRGFCLAHDDRNTPSCDYNREKNTYHCKTCEASGGVLSLIVAAKAAPSLSAAAKWLKAKGLLRASHLADAWQRVDCTYDYTDENGKLLYQVGRWSQPHKAFGQRASDGEGGWKKGKDVMKGVRRVPYRLPDLLLATSAGREVYVVEGEKDADRLHSLGLCATTNAMGAGTKWPITWADFFAGACRVVIIGDNDDAGREAARSRAGIVARSVADVRVIQSLPGVSEHGDVSDWLDAGGTLDALAAIVAEAERAVAYRPPYTDEALAALLRDLTDTGNAKWLYDVLGDDVIRYVQDRKRWIGYNGKVWDDRVNTHAVTLRAVELMASAARDLANDDFTEHASWSKSLKGRNNMLEGSIAYLQAYSDRFDKRRHLLNLDNGTFDLFTRELQPHRAGDLLTRSSAVAYDEAATAPKFEAWLRYATMVAGAATGEWSASPALYEYCLLLMGACLEARAGLRRFFCLLGPKGTGKSTFAHVLQRLLGTYHTSTDFAVLCERKNQDGGQGPSPALVRLNGARVVTVAEGSAAMKLDAARLKQLVGGDTLSARRLNQDVEDFMFEATLLLHSNEMPNLDASPSTFEKFKPIPFAHPIEQEDAEFEDRELWPELPGIMNIALAAHGRLRAANYRIEDPAEVAALRESVRTEQNPLSEFIGECFTINAAEREQYKAVWSIYNEWCKQNNRVPIRTTRIFWKAMRDSCKLRSAESHGINYVLGVALNPNAVNRYSRSEAPY